MSGLRARPRPLEKYGQQNLNGRGGISVFRQAKPIAQAQELLPMQNAAAEAYNAVARQTASPRELEADLLLKAASRLQAIFDAWDSKKSSLDDALLYNRKLWSIFMASATSPEHSFPTEIRQNIANLGIFVMNQTLSLMTDPQPERLNSLININRELAAGLRGQA
jgi:flagellar protein FlaF